MPVLINNSEQAYAESRLLVNGIGSILKKGFAHGRAGGSLKALGNTKNAGLSLGKKIAGGAGIAAGRIVKSASDAEVGFRVGRRVADAPYKNVAGLNHPRASRSLKAGLFGGMSVAKAGRFAKNHPKALIGGAAGAGALAGGAALSRKKRTTTNEEHMSTVFVNNSEQLLVEHQVLLNRLTAQSQPKQMVGNGIGSLLQKGVGAAKKFAGRVGAGAGQAAKGMKAGFKSPSARLYGSKAYQAGGKVGAAIGKEAGHAKSFARANPKMAIGGGLAAAGTAGIGGGSPLVALRPRQGTGKR